MVELNEAEQMLLANLYDQQLLAVLKDIKECYYMKLRGQITKVKAHELEVVLRMELPPPMFAWGQRQRKHYRLDEVFNRMVQCIEQYPQLRSSNIDRAITKMRMANDVPIPQ
jgi:hypothetical protein